MLAWIRVSRPVRAPLITLDSIADSLLGTDIFEHPHALQALEDSWISIWPGAYQHAGSTPGTKVASFSLINVGNGFHRLRGFCFLSYDAGDYAPTCKQDHTLLHPCTHTQAGLHWGCLICPGCAECVRSSLVHFVVYNQLQSYNSFASRWLAYCENSTQP